MAIEWMLWDDILRDFTQVSKADLLHWIYEDKILTAFDRTTSHPIDWQKEKEKLVYMKQNLTIERCPDELPDRYGAMKRVPYKSWEKLYLWAKNFPSNEILITNSQYLEILEGWNIDRVEERATGLKYKKEELGKIINIKSHLPYLVKENNPYYSPELAALVKTWMEVFDKKSIPFDTKEKPGEKQFSLWRKSITDCLRGVQSEEFTITNFARPDNQSMAIKIIAGKKLVQIIKLIKNQE